MHDFGLAQKQAGRKGQDFPTGPNHQPHAGVLFMATQSHITRTQPGPVSQAVAVMRRADPDRYTPAAIRDRLLARLTTLLLVVEGF